MTNIIFLDIDGVLTSDRVHRARNEIYKDEMNCFLTQFDPVAIEFFNKISSKHDISFCLISTWKNNLGIAYMIPHWIDTCFYNAGFRGKFLNELKTEDEHEHSRSRGIELLMEDYPDSNYIIIDDCDFDWTDHQRERWVMTDPDNGILLTHMKQIENLIKDWN